MLKCRLSLVFVLLCLCFAVEAALSSNVGYRRIEIQDTATGETFPVAIWYPTDAQPSVLAFGPYTMRVARDAAPAEGKFGLVVISHGSGGGALDHRDLAMALASAGYAVAAPMQPRDNFRDMSGVGSVSVWAGRPRQVSLVVDRVLEDQALGSPRPTRTHRCRGSFSRRLHRACGRRCPAQHERPCTALQRNSRRRQILFLWRRRRSGSRPKRWRHPRCP